MATPFAKKLAKQHKVDIEKVIGTGPYGRITPEDVEKAAGIAPAKSPTPVAAPVAAAAAAAPVKASAASPAALSDIPGATVVPFTTMQAAVSKNMVESLTVPTFRVGYPINTDALDALYEKVHWFLFFLFSLNCGETQELVAFVVIRILGFEKDLNFINIRLRKRALL